jgi:hypothetical protein
MLKIEKIRDLYQMKINRSMEMDILEKYKVKSITYVRMCMLCFTVYCFDLLLRKYGFCKM